MGIQYTVLKHTQQKAYWWCMGTIETIGSKLIQEGIRRGYSVVPEFTISSEEVQYVKKVDLAWITPLEREDMTRPGSLAIWRLIAVFEIEGCDVAKKRIRQHSEQFQDLQVGLVENFSKNIVLYNKAYHRKDRNWEKPNPGTMIQNRIDVASEAGVVLVRDGRSFEWLNEI